MEDAEVPEFWRALGIPGLVDAHVHFMPERVLRKVWAFFERLGDWPVVYLGDE